MISRIKLRLLIITLLPFLGLAQNTKKGTPYQDIYFGIGAGLDYGGFGAKMELLPSKQTGFFLGGGYNLLGLSYNAGLSIKLIPKNNQTPTLIAMYGYNAVVDYYNLIKTYFGPTFGIGYDYEVGKKHHKISAALLFPVRNKSFKDDINSIPEANQPKVNKILFSIGFNLAGSTKKQKK